MSNRIFGADPLRTRRADPADPAGQEEVRFCALAHPKTRPISNRECGTSLRWNRALLCEGPIGDADFGRGNCGREGFHNRLSRALSPGRPCCKGKRGDLVEYKGLHGILTAAHVDESLREAKATHRARCGSFSRACPIRSSKSSILEEIFSTWRGLTPASGGRRYFVHFTSLHLVGNIAQQSLCPYPDTSRKNQAKDEPEPSTSLIQTHANLRSGSSLRERPTTS